MFKLTTFLWIGLIAWNLHISQAQPVNCNNSDGALQDPAMQRNKLGDLFTIIGSVLLTPPYGSPDGVSLNGTTSSLDEKEEQPSRAEKQLMALLTRMEVQLENIASSVRRIPEDFIRLGSRYFYFIYSAKTFNDANIECRRIGGHLATIQSQEELHFIKDYTNTDYWLALNDQAMEGHYVSSVSNKTAPFLNWNLLEPSDRDHTKNCVALSNGFMYNANCNEKKKVMCQAYDDIYLL